MFHNISDEALASLDLDGSVAIGRSPLSVSRSRTAICPINPKFLPQVTHNVFLPSFDLHPKDVAMPNNVLILIVLLFCTYSLKLSGRCASGLYIAPISAKLYVN